MTIIPGTLRSRMLWAGVIPLGVAAVVLMFVEPRLVRKAADQDLRDIAGRIVNGWEAFDILARSPEELQRAVLLSAAAPSIRSAALLRRSDGLVLAASQQRWIGRTFADPGQGDGYPSAAEILPDPAQTAGPFTRYEDRVFRITLPLRIIDRQFPAGNELEALAFIEFDRAETEAHSRALLRPIIWGGFATAIILIAVAQTAIIAGVARPLEKIAWLARRGTKLDLSGFHARRDEIGFLVRSLHAAQEQAAEERSRLEQSRAQVLDILEGFGDPVAMMDRGHNLTYVNRAARMRLGWDESAIGTPMEPRVVESGLGDFRALVERAVATPAEVISGEVEVWGKRMVRESATLSVRALPEAEGEPKILLHLHLTTERKLAEAALREREEIFSAIVEQAPDAIALAEIRTGKFAEFNRQAHSMLGYTRAEYAEFGIGDIEANFPPEQVQRILGEFLTIGHGTIETRHRHRDGRLVDVIVTMRCLKIRGTDYVAAIWRDVTEAKQKEAQRRELSLVVEQIPVSIVITDLDGRIEYTNSYFTTLTGYSARHALGCNPRFLKSGLTAPAVFAELWSTLRQGKIWHGEVVNRAKSGALLVESVTIVPLADEQGRITRYVSLQQDITERRRAETALAESETRFRDLFELAPLPLAYSSGQGEIIGLNRQFTKIFGYRRTDLPTVARWFERAYPEPNYRKNRIDEWEHAVRQRDADPGATIALTSEITCLDGSTRIADVSGVSAGGGMIVAFVDLTERMKAEARIRQLSRAVEQAPLSVIITDLDGRIEYVNPHATVASGYESGEILGRNPRMFRSEETPSAVFTEMWARLKRGEVWRGELVNRRKDGSTSIEDVVVAPITDGGSRITNYVALKTDVTAQREAARALAESEARYRLIAENTSDAIWLFDLGQRVFTYVSPSCLRLLGYPPAELVGRGISAVLAPSSTAAAERHIEERIAAFLAGDQAALHLVRVYDLRHRDGRIVRGEVVSTLLTDAAGRPHQLLGISRDVTERENAALELRASRDRLLAAESIAKLGHWEVDLATGAVRMSAEARSIYEIGPDEAPVTLERMMQQVHPGDAPAVLPACRHALQTQTDHVSTHRLKSKSTGCRYVEVKLCFQGGTEAEMPRVFGTTQDVTSSKVAELELHGLVKELRVMHEIAQFLDHARDDLGELVAGIAGLLPGIVPDSDAMQATVEIDGLRRTRGAPGACADAASVEIRINDQPAGSITMGYVAAALAEPTEVTVRDLETLKDIARSIGHALSAKRARTALERFNADLEDKVRLRTAELASRQREMQGLLHSIPDLVLHLRSDGTVVHCHRSHDSATLAAMADPAKQPVVQNETLRAVCAELGARVVQTCVGTAETVLEHNSRSVHVELRAAAVSNTEFVVFVRDISARKQQEADAAAMFERERQVSEMKTRFVSVASHEFRTPMAAAMGSAELLQNHYERLAAPKRAELFGRIQTAMQRMTAMLDDILTMSRLDAGRVAPAFVQGVVDEIRAGDRDAHRFALETAGGAGSFSSDPKLLHHVLSNILSNSARYSPRDTEVTIRIQLGPILARIEIADRGIGIPEADLPRIFEPFERASNVGSIKGTGLGLSIVKRMTEMLGGRVAVESAVGQGTRFILDLPVRPAAP